MDNNNFSYSFCGENGAEWRVLMEKGNLTINNCSYERDNNDPIYDFVIAMHKIINEVDDDNEATCDFTEFK